MDEGLSRGYATSFVQKQTDHGAILAWIESPRPAQAFKKFLLSTQREHEGRVIESMEPLISPPFSNIFIPSPWTKSVKSLGAQLVSAAPETEVFQPDHIDDWDKPEKSVFLNNLLYIAVDGKVEDTLLTVANMSHHTITRFLQRGLADERSLNRLVWLSMSIARDLAQIFQLTSLEQKGAFDFLIPFMGGALVARTMKVSPGIEKSYQGDRWVFSLRTFLEDSMLKPIDRERMAGMEIKKDGSVQLRWLGQTREMQRGFLKEADVNHLKGWLQANARPTRSRSAVG